MKIRLYYYIDDLGDGSAVARFFTTKEDCIANAELEEYTLTDGLWDSYLIETDNFKEVN